MVLSQETQIAPIPYGLAITGRIRDWLKDSTSRLPVSCTAYEVEDSMEGVSGIEDSWAFTSKALRYAAGVAIHLSKLRPRGTSNGKGLISSGPVSFGTLYSKINEILRRGGAFRNGATTLHVRYDHSDAMDFVRIPRSELRWAKKCLDVPETLAEFKARFTPEEFKEILLTIAKGDLFLHKLTYDKNGEQLLNNVCLEVLIKHRGSCLLAHENLGQLKEEEIIPAFVAGMEWLCELHAVTGVGESGIYLSPEEDKQVGLGVIGLANHLAIAGISYADFTRALEIVVDIQAPDNESKIAINSEALSLSQTIYTAYQKAGEVAKRYGMERAFTIAPTANASFSYRDRLGYVTAPEIAPPIAIEIERVSGTMAGMFAEYNPDSEIAIDVGWPMFLRLNSAWQKMMEMTGLAHSISMNWWSDLVNMDEKTLGDWFASFVRSLYYAQPVRPDSLDKSQVVVNEEAESTPNFYETEVTCSLEESNEFCSSCSETL